MASTRQVKKDIDFLVSEVIADSYLAIYFHPEQRDGIISVIQEAVNLRNNLFERVNNPDEKNNASLVKKHFRHVREEMFTTVEELFSKLSTLTQKKAASKKEA